MEEATLGRAARRRAAGTVGGGLAVTAFWLGVVALLLAGCAAIVVLLLPDAANVIDLPYAVAAAIALLLGIPSLVCGAVAWRRASRAGVNASVAIAGFTLGVVAVVLGGALVSFEALRWYGLV